MESLSQYANATILSDLILHAEPVVKPCVTLILWQLTRNITWIILLVRSALLILVLMTYTMSMKEMYYVTIIIQHNTLFGVKVVASPSSNNLSKAIITNVGMQNAT